MTLAHTLEKYQLDLDAKLALANEHMQFMSADARVHLNRVQGAWKMAATIAMLAPAQWYVSGITLRSGINAIFAGETQETYNLLRSFLPGVIAKYKYGDEAPPDWVNIAIINGLNAPANVVGTDGLIYRVSSDFAEDYKSAEKTTYKYLTVTPVTADVNTVDLADAKVDVGNYSITVPMKDKTGNATGLTANVTVDIPSKQKSLISTSNNSTSIFGKPTTITASKVEILDDAPVGNARSYPFVVNQKGPAEFSYAQMANAIELAFFNAGRLYCAIDGDAKVNNRTLAASALQGIALHTLTTIECHVGVLKKLSLSNTETFYPTALANWIRSMEYSVEHEGAIQYRYKMYHPQIENGRDANAPVTPGDCPPNIPKSTWQRAHDTTLQTRYRRSLGNLNPNAAADYAKNLLPADPVDASKALAPDLLCYKAYAYAYGVNVGGELKSLTIGGVLQATGIATESAGTQNAFARHAKGAALYVTKLLPSIWNLRDTSADTYARLLFPLAMYVSLLELRFGTSNTAVLPWTKGPEKVAPKPMGKKKAIGKIRPVRQADEEAQPAFDKFESAISNSLQLAAADKHYDATLLGILDCLLSAAYFVYQTIGWDYSIGGIASKVDKFIDWALFEDPLLIGYITLRRKYVEGYDTVIDEHCEYLATKLENDSKWWAPSYIPNRISLGAFIAKPGAWLRQTLEDMSTWLCKAEFDWNLSTDNLLQLNGDKLALSGDDGEVSIKSGIAKYVEKRLQLRGYRSDKQEIRKQQISKQQSIRPRSSSFGAKPMSNPEIAASCQLLRDYLQKGGDQKLTVELIIDMLEQLATSSEHSPSSNGLMQSSRKLSRQF